MQGGQESFSARKSCRASRRVHETAKQVLVADRPCTAQIPVLPDGRRLKRGVGRTHPQKGNHGNTDWKVPVLWKNDSNVALWRYNWRRNVSHCMFRMQRKRPPTKRTVERLMAMGCWLDICDWLYDWYVLCCSRSRWPLTLAVRRLAKPIGKSDLYNEES